MSPEQPQPRHQAFVELKIGPASIFEAWVTKQPVHRDDEARARKVAMNQSAFRAANERLRRAAGSHRFREADRVPFICECADEHCREIVMLALSDYEHIRAHPTWFLLVAGHEEEDAGLERIVDAEQGYAIVEKIGTAGEEAARLHPREAENG